MKFRSLAYHRLLSPDANVLEVCSDVECHGVRQEVANLRETIHQPISP